MVEVNPLTKAELKELTRELKKVPVVHMAFSGPGPSPAGAISADGSDVIMGESSAIISYIASEVEASKGAPKPSRWGARGGNSAAAAAAAEEEARWRRWVDERLVKTVTANIYRSWE